MHATRGWWENDQSLPDHSFHIRFSNPRVNLERLATTHPAWHTQSGPWMTYWVFLQSAPCRFSLYSICTASMSAGVSPASSNHQTYSLWGMVKKKSGWSTCAFMFTGHNGHSACPVLSANALPLLPLDLARRHHTSVLFRDIHIENPCLTPIWNHDIIIVVDTIPLLSGGSPRQIC